uniref:Uncharacterized protein n=1 Tax=Melopsittacus undulatus TaxID=13146 RepID=A0A8V5FVM5_MELUD
MAPRGRKRKAQQPAAAEAPDPGGTGPRVVIEHCAALRGAVAHLAVDINPRQPRRNSFEVSLVKEDGSSDGGQLPAPVLSPMLQLCREQPPLDSPSSPRIPLPTPFSPLHPSFPPVSHFTFLYPSFPLLIPQ